MFVAAPQVWAHSSGGGQLVLRLRLFHEEFFYEEFYEEFFYQVFYEEFYVQETPCGGAPLPRDCNWSHSRFGRSSPRRYLDSARNGTYLYTWLLRCVA